MTVVEDEKLKNYINGFYGYGKWESSIWYIGIEEAGGENWKDVKNRINSWESFQSNLIDNKKHHDKIGYKNLFDGKVNIQKTWAGLIRLRQGYENKPIDAETIRKVQKLEWGQIESDNLLIELFPLPAKKNDEKSWIYHESKINFLNSRSQYESTIAPSRIEFIKEKIKSFNPKIVILYSSSKLNYWNKIIEDDFKENGFELKISGFYFRIITKNNTCFVQTPHPNGIRGKGLKINEIWESVGKKIKEICP